MQLATRFQKYYKSLFLGVVDMAVVNAYIVHAHVWEKERKKKMSHYSFLTTLHRQLIQETESSFTEEGISTEPTAVVREKPIAIQGDH
ncbi:hypothetical protein PInf_004282 [Phytophthora infestans]|nr:hypothetical protein PInf_004282 [Phytophthora infestans]